jgi:hypothetical protein
MKHQATGMRNDVDLQTEVSEDNRVGLEKALKEISVIVRDGTKTKKEMKEYLEKAVTKLNKIKDKL